MMVKQLCTLGTASCMRAFTGSRVDDERRTDPLTD